MFFKGKAKAPVWQVAIVGQVHTYARLPYIEVAYLIVGLLVVWVAPGPASRVRAGLAAGSAP